MAAAVARQSPALEVQNEKATATEAARQIWQMTSSLFREIEAVPTNVYSSGLYKSGDGDDELDGMPLCRVRVEGTGIDTTAVALFSGALQTQPLEFEPNVSPV